MLWKALSHVNYESSITASMVLAIYDKELLAHLVSKLSTSQKKVVALGCDNELEFFGAVESLISYSKFLREDYLPNLDRDSSETESDDSSHQERAEELNEAAHFLKEICEVLDYQTGHLINDFENNIYFNKYIAQEILLKDYDLHREIWDNGASAANIAIQDIPSIIQGKDPKLLFRLLTTVFRDSTDKDSILTSMLNVKDSDGEFLHNEELIASVELVKDDADILYKILIMSHPDEKKITVAGMIALHDMKIFIDILDNLSLPAVKKIIGSDKGGLIKIFKENASKEDAKKFKNALLDIIRSKTRDYEEYEQEVSESGFINKREKDSEAFPSYLMNKKESSQALLRHYEDNKDLWIESAKSGNINPQEILDIVSNLDDSIDNIKKLVRLVCGTQKIEKGSLNQESVIAEFFKIDKDPTLILIPFLYLIKSDSTSLTDVLSLIDLDDNWTLATSLFVRNKEALCLFMPSLSTKEKIKIFNSNSEDNGTNHSLNTMLKKGFGAELQEFADYFGCVVPTEAQKTDENPTVFIGASTDFE
jgi:hypothetical protein